MKRLARSQIRNQLSKLGISQVTVAERLDLSPSTISAWLKGKSFPDNANLEKLAEMLQLSIDEMIEAEELNSQISSSAIHINEVHTFCCSYGNIPLDTEFPRHSSIPMDSTSPGASVWVSCKIQPEMMYRILEYCRMWNMNLDETLHKLLEDSVHRQSDATYHE